MSHTALARKYRPRRFAEVATQEHVSETLRRAVSTDRVGHAYLFCGPRGVGKTTLARVLAMSLNCPKRGDDGEPCGECEDCRRIWSGTTSLDVVEIDAATNRGVDDARQLRERAMYAPSEEGRFKVYIVDEAHMLTREAWNALLKILEEPPSRVIFIFATTEPQKIEQTAAPILSRCQRFDFRRVGVPDMMARLREVLEWEGTGAEEEALRLIARKADGGMRDALSITDQILAMSAGPLDVAAVRQVLGVVEEERYLELFDLLAERDRGGLFALVESLLDDGYDLVEFYHGLVEALRTLLRLRVGGGEAELPKERLEEWRASSQRFDPGEFVRMLSMAAELETTGSLRRTQQPRVLLELLLLRFSYLDRTVGLEELLRSLGEADTFPEPLPRLDEGPPLKRSKPKPTRPRPEPESTRPEPKPPRPEPTPTRSEATAPRPEPEPEPTAPPSGPPTPPSGPPTPPSGPPTPAPDTDRKSSPLEGWGALLQSGEGIPAGLSVFLRGARVEEGKGELRILLPPGPALERLSDPPTSKAVEEALARHLESPISLRFQAEEGAGGASETRVSTSSVREGRLQDLLKQEPGLKEAVKELDLEIVD